VLVDRGQLVLQLRLQVRDDLGIAFHGELLLFWLREPEPGILARTAPSGRRGFSGTSAAAPATGCPTRSATAARAGMAGAATAATRAPGTARACAACRCWPASPRSSAGRGPSRPRGACAR